MTDLNELDDEDLYIDDELEQVWIGPRDIYSVFGVTHKKLKSSGLKSVNGKYDFEEFWRALGDYIIDRLAEKRRADDRYCNTCLQLKASHE